MQAFPAKQSVVAALMRVGESFPTSPKEGFANSDVALDIPVGMQLILISALLIVFKLAIDSDEEAEESDSSEAKEKPNVQLVNTSHIAFRLAIAAGTIGVGKLAGPTLTRSVNAVMDSGELLATGGMLGASTALVLWNAQKQSQNSKI